MPLNNLLPQLSSIYTLDEKQKIRDLWWMAEKEGFSLDTSEYLHRYLAPPPFIAASALSELKYLPIAKQQYYCKRLPMEYQTLLRTFIKIPSFYTPDAQLKSPFLLWKIAHHLTRYRDLDEQDERLWAAHALEYLAPQAKALGSMQAMHDLQAQAFHILHPHIATTLERTLKKTYRQAQPILKIFSQQLHQIVPNIKYQLMQRTKTPYSIYRKTQEKMRPAHELCDIIGVRLLVNEVNDCYELLEGIHHQFPQIVEEFDDYIANPKPNGYQSLHTALHIGRHRLEVQIRTHYMHHHAEYGDYAHWHYKHPKANYSANLG